MSRSPHSDPPPETDLEVLETFDDGVGIRKARITVRRKLPGSRLDKYLVTRFKKASRTIIQKLIKGGDVLVNGKPSKNSYEMEGGDVIDVTFPPPVPYDLKPEDIPLDIVYEDDYLLAINKPIDMIAHPANRTQGGTVANAVAFYSKNLSSSDDPFRPGIIHRLDKNTTGIMVIAKTDEAHWRISRQFENRTTEKVYQAVVHGSPEFDEDIIDIPIGQHPTVHDRYIATGFAERLGSKFEKRLHKNAVTRYKVLERFSGYTLIELYPKTGRTHQLRIHMSHLKHPIVGDPFYGGRNIGMQHVTGRPTDSADLIWNRQMLHACRLTITHPIEQTPLTMEAPLPEDFESLLAALREYAVRGKGKR